MPIKAVVDRVRLTRRQRQVITLLAEGYSNREIAERLDISLDGAKWHVGEILLKLNVNSREAAAAWWIARAESAGDRSRSLWAVALALPWKLAAAIGGMFGLTSAMRPRVQTDHAALSRDTAVTETWQPPPPPSIVAPMIDCQLSGHVPCCDCHREPTATRRATIIHRPNGDRTTDQEN